MGSRSWWPRKPEARSRPSFLGAIGLDLPPLEAGRPGDPGLFGPGSEVWKVGRERVLLSGGASALLLQVAHPLVAIGVLEHTDFPRNAFDRLRATLDATLRITFGDTDQAERAAARVRATHARVRGGLTQPMGPYPAGTSYQASDPELALWVHATLVITALDTYDRFVGRLTQDARSKYYEEAKRFGALFGATDGVMPRTYEGFRSYIRDMIRGGTLWIGDAAKTLAVDILSPPMPRALAPARFLNRMVTAGLLPPPIREGFGLTWTARDRRVFSALALSSRAALPITPAGLRFWPHFRAATKRTTLR